MIPENTSSQFLAKYNDQGIEILEKGSRVLFYQKVPKSVNGQYERAGFIHPLYNLDGTIITEDTPDDHPYHRGIFWAWHQVLLKEVKIADGWISENISFGPVNTTVRKWKNRIVINAELLWKSNTPHSQPKNLIKENSIITIYSAEKEYRTIDFNIHLSALFDSLSLGGSEDEKGYGGFCLRLKLPADILFNSDGADIIPQETAVKTAPWMDFSGSFSGKDSSRSGVAVFCIPSQPGDQQSWILRRQKSMQNIVYPGNKAKPISKKGWVLKYRMIIHTEKIDAEQLKTLYRQFLDQHI